MSVFDECVNWMRGRRKEEEEMDYTIDMKTDNKPLQKTAGYLEKRGKLKFMNSWKKYWFVLEGHLLLYYGSKDDYDGLSPCKGSISLGHTSTVKPYSPVPLGFQITIRSSTITLRAETAAEQTKWMQAFVTALNPNQNTNESPTKLNHFRYSAENLNMLVENKEDFQGTPNSSPQGISPQHTPKTREAPLIDRLQKLGARSYSSNSSVQNQILEGVRNSRQRSIVKETVTEQNRKEDLDEKEINQEHRDFGKKKEDVILEDDDFCVCTLGKEDADNEESGTTKKGLKNESDTSFSVKSSILNQELNSEFIRRRKSNDSKKCGTSQVDDAAVDDQLNSAERINRSINKNKHIMKKSLSDEPEVELNENRGMIKPHKPPHSPNNPPLYENVDIKQEFYLHRDSNPEPATKNCDTTKLIQVKPPRKMKNNIQDLFLESRDKSSLNRTVDGHEKRNSEDEGHTDPVELNQTYLREEKLHKQHANTKSEEKHDSYGETHKDKISFNSCDILTTTNAECNKERLFKNSTNLQTVPEDDLGMNIPNENNFKSNQLFNKQLQSNTDYKEFDLNVDSKDETLAKTDSEVSAPVHAVNRTRNFRNNHNTLVESESDRAESSIKKSHSKPRGDLSNLIMTVQRSLEKHCTKSPTKTEQELLSQPALKDETLTECKTDITPHVYAEVIKQRKLQHNLHSQTDPEDGLVTCRANSNLFLPKGMSFNVISSIDQPRDKCHFTKPITMKTDSKVQLHTELNNESTLETDSTKTPPFYSEINKELKLKNRMQVHPKQDLLTSTAKSSCIEPRDQSTLKDNAGSAVPIYSQPIKDRKSKETLRTHTEQKDVITTSGTKEYHDEVKRTNMQMVSHLTPREEKSGRKTPNHSENIYEEPEDIHSASPKLVTRSHPLMKSDAAVPIYAEPTIETVSTIKQDPYSGYMTDNDIYATPNNEVSKPEDSGQTWNSGNLNSLATEELQCEMDFYDETIDEFECENGLYGSPEELLNTPTDSKAISNDIRQNDVLCQSWKRQFQFPPPPIDDAPIYAEPNVPVAENIRISRGSNDKFEHQQVEYEMENELYAESNRIQKNNYEYPEYEEPEIICDDVVVETSKLDRKAEEVEYSCIPETDNKTGYYYTRPFKTDDFHVYEDPEEYQFETKQEKSENTKAKKKNTRQKSDPLAKIEPSGKTEETKKGDHFIQKIFKQATRKNSDKSDKGGDILLGANADETLVMLTDIQQILERKKRMIKAMAQQEREVEARRIHFKSKSANSDCRSKSYPSRSPDLLKDLSKHIGFRGLEDEYATVCDHVKENIYSEVVNDIKIDGKQRHPIGTGKYGTWAHGKVSDND